DEAVIAAIAGKRERRSVRRPLQFIGGGFSANRFDRLSAGLSFVQRSHPDLTVFQKRDAAIARNGGSPAVAQFPCSAAIEGNRIDRLLRRFGKISGIGDIAV